MVPRGSSQSRRKKNKAQLLLRGFHDSVTLSRYCNDLMDKKRDHPYLCRQQFLEGSGQSLLGLPYRSARYIVSYFSAISVIYGYGASLMNESALLNIICCRPFGNSSDFWHFLQWQWRLCVRLKCYECNRYRRCRTSSYLLFVCGVILSC